MELLIILRSVSLLLKLIMVSNWSNDNLLKSSTDCSFLYEFTIEKRLVNRFGLNITNSWYNLLCDKKVLEIND